VTGIRQRRESEAAMLLRIEHLEKAFEQMKTTMKWQTAIGVYLASIVTALAFKILFFGI
jgi:hypothetical protein